MVKSYTTAAQMSLVVLNQREDIQSVQLRAALQESKLHREGSAHHLAAKLLDKFGGRRRRAPGGQQVVADNHALPRFDRVLMDFQSIFAVLQRIRNADGLGRQFFRL